MFKTFLVSIPHVLFFWPVAVAIHVVLFLLGGIVFVPFCLLVYKNNSMYWPSFINSIWGNDAQPNPTKIKWYMANVNRKGGWRKKYPSYNWFAVRNKAANLRHYFQDPDYEDLFIATSYDHEKFNVESAAKTHGSAWRFLACGWKASFRWVSHNNGTANPPSEFYIGWKLNSSTPGLGFTCGQFRWKPTT